MAVEPSKSKNKGKGRGLEKPAEPSMLPIMNLMVVLIPILLSAAEMIKIRTLTVNLPVGHELDAGGEDSGQAAQSEIKRLGLNIIITEKGFVINALETRLKLVDEIKPEIETLNGKTYEIGKDSLNITPEIEADYENGFSGETYSKLNTLLVKLRELLREKEIKVSDKDLIVIGADNAINFQTVVSTIDAVRMYENEKGEMVDLFPGVQFGGF